jgi:hypothetical protein
VTSLFLSLDVSFLPVVSFPTATSTPLLRIARPERFAARLSVDPGVSQSSKVFAFSLSHSLIPTVTFSPVGTITSGVAGAPPHSALLTLMLLFLSLRRGPTHPQGPYHHLL